MGGDLCERAAEGMAGDVYRTIPIFFSQLDGLLGQGEGITALCVDPGGDHRGVDAAVNQGLAVKLGTAMGDDYFFGSRL